MQQLLLPFKYPSDLHIYSYTSPALNRQHLRWHHKLILWLLLITEHWQGKCMKWNPSVTPETDAPRSPVTVFHLHQVNYHGSTGRHRPDTARTLPSQPIITSNELTTFTDSGARCVVIIWKFCQFSLNESICIKAPHQKIPKYLTNNIPEVQCSGRLNFLWKHSVNWSW